MKYFIILHLQVTIKKKTEAQMTYLKDFSGRPNTDNYTDHTFSPHASLFMFTGDKKC